MKIGIFGGSFNPPHIMHKNIALELTKDALDKVIYVPTGSYYNKKDLVPVKYRYDMLKLMTKNSPNLEVSLLSENNNFEYTYQVLDYFQDKYRDSEIYFICGTDNLKELDTWKNYAYILENYKIIVIKRNDDDIKTILDRYSKYKDNIIVSNILKSEISSSYIRDNLLTSNRFLDDDVLKYILERKLYK